MSAKKYFGAFCLYLNYLVHGIGVLVMSLNVHEFEVQWQTDAAGVSVVISSLGLAVLRSWFWRVRFQTNTAGVPSCCSAL